MAKIKTFTSDDFASLMVNHVQMGAINLFTDLMREEICKSVGLPARFATGGMIPPVTSFQVRDLEEMHECFDQSLCPPPTIECTITFDRPWHRMDRDLVRILKRETKERERQRWNKKRRNK